MQEAIMRLIELQKIDLEILKIDKAMNEIPQSLQKAQENKEQITKKLEELSSIIEEKKKQKDLFEEELKEEYQKLKSTQARLIQIRGTREYQLLLREIEEIKKANKQKEEEILKLMEEIENLEKEKANLENELTKAEEVFKEEKQKFDAFCEELSNNKAELLKKREDIAQKIPPNLLRKYEILRQRKGGIGIAPVINYVCEGCHMSIPPQLYNEIQKDNRYYECPHCKRLIFYKKIYMPEEDQENAISDEKASTA
jgi:predicted  nucleic acid-binding Zn-ribbon protein